MIGFDNYMRPITACILSVDNRIPIGIKITGYDPIQCQEDGFFIYVCPQEWEWIGK